MGKLILGLDYTPKRDSKGNIYYRDNKGKNGYYVDWARHSNGQWFYRGRALNGSFSKWTPVGNEQSRNIERARGIINYLNSARTNRDSKNTTDRYDTMQNFSKNAWPAIRNAYGIQMTNRDSIYGAPNDSITNSRLALIYNILPDSTGNYSIPDSIWDDYLNNYTSRFNDTITSKRPDSLSREYVYANYDRFNPSNNSDSSYVARWDSLMNAQNLRLRVLNNDLILQPNILPEIVVTAGENSLQLDNQTNLQSQNNNQLQNTRQSNRQQSNQQQNTLRPRINWLQQWINFVNSLSPEDKAILESNNILTAADLQQFLIDKGIYVGRTRVDNKWGRNSMRGWKLYKSNNTTKIVDLQHDNPVPVGVNVSVPTITNPIKPINIPSRVIPDDVYYFSQYKHGGLIPRDAVKRFKDRI